MLYSETTPPQAKEIAAALEFGIINILEGGMRADDLEELSSAIESAGNVFDENVGIAVNDAVEREIDNSYLNVADIDSESMLEDQIMALQNLSPRAGISAERLDRAVSVLKDRISEINEAASEAEPPSFTGRAPWEPEVFDDIALRGLFEPLTYA
jgi:hypothetical protein